MVCGRNSVAGIFSREDRSTYDWLIQMVLGSPGVKDVRSVHITKDWSDFAEEIPKCSFAILFHSKSRGHVNVTNVTDSLYDRELQHLSRVFGKEKVMVVIGDVEDSSAGEKDRILSEQPDILTKARDLFLFNAISDDQAQPEGQTAELQNTVQTIAGKFYWKDCDVMRMVGTVIVTIFLIIMFIFLYAFLRDCQ